MHDQMKSKLTISIITPSFNQGCFLEDTIRSVISQEGDFYLDYIIMDGGSSDNSCEVIKKYDSLLREGRWPVNCAGIKYRWFSEPDQGQSDAIRKGVALAEGVLLAWLNSDDTYLTGALSRVAEAFYRFPSAGLFYGRAHFTDWKGLIAGEVETGLADFKGLATLNLVCQPAAFISKTAWDAVGGLDPELHYTMDHDLWIRMAREFTFEYLNEFLATYRLHDESKTFARQSAVKFHAEIIRTVLKYYGRVPVNRVFGYCQRLVTVKAPAVVVKSTLLRTVVTSLFAIFEYLRLNKRIYLADLKMLNRKNFAKVRIDLPGKHPEKLS